MAPCILEAQIPCLASRTWLQDVGAIIDMNKREVYLGLFDVTLPLVLINCHLGLNVSEFAPRQRCFQFWHDHLQELQVSTTTSRRDWSGCWIRTVSATRTASKTPGCHRVGIRHGTNTRSHQFRRSATRSSTGSNSTAERQHREICVHPLRRGTDL